MKVCGVPSTRRCLLPSWEKRDSELNSATAPGQAVKQQHTQDFRLQSQALLTTFRDLEAGSGSLSPPLSPASGLGHQAELHCALCPDKGSSYAQTPCLSHSPEPSGLGPYFVTGRAKHSTKLRPSLSADAGVLELRGAPETAYHAPGESDPSLS